jgi:Ca2+-binding RTX toxin-like protein
MEGLVPGDALPFYNQQPAIPYALQSSYEALSDEAGLPINSAFQGSLALKAAIWIPDGLPAGFNPALYLAPVEASLGQPGQIMGGIGRDVITGTSANERILAGRGRDKVLAGGGDDSLLGQQGDDQLFGEAGRDQLTGGKGTNRCWGGAGQDIFVLSARGLARVMDWTKGQDQIVVEGVASFGIVTDGSDALVVSGTGGKLAIIKHAAGQLVVSEADPFTII